MSYIMINNHYLMFRQLCLITLCFCSFYSFEIQAQRRTFELVDLPNWRIDLDLGTSIPLVKSKRSLDIVLSTLDSSIPLDRRAATFNLETTAGYSLGIHPSATISPRFSLGILLLYRSKQAFSTVFYQSEALEINQSSQRIFASGGYDLNFSVSSFSTYLSAGYDFFSLTSTSRQSVRAAFGIELGVGFAAKNLLNSVPNTSFFLVSDGGEAIERIAFSNSSSIASEKNRFTDFSWYIAPYLKVPLDQKLTLELGARLADQGQYTVYERPTGREELINIFIFDNNLITSKLALVTKNHQSRLFNLETYLRVKYLF